jgi:aminopeptidase N
MSKTTRFKFGALLTSMILLLLACRFGAPLPATATAPNFATTAPTIGPSPTIAPPIINGQACPLGTPDTSFQAPADAQPGANGVGDNYFPDLGNSGYNVQHYQINLAVDLDREEINGCTAIQAIASQDLSGINLEFAGLQIDEISVDGAAAEYSRDGLELVVAFPEPKANGQPFTVVVEYHGQPGEGVNVSSIPEYSIGWAWYSDGVYVAAEPTGSSSWYPNNEHPLDKATYGYRITVPKPYEVAANGLLQDTIDNGDTRTYVWDSKYPMASYLATIGIGDFDIETESGPEGLPIRIYFEKDIPQSTRNNFARMADIIAFYESIYGPYPFEAAGAVVHDVDLDFSLEAQTLIVFGGSFTDEYVVAHELAHQWFGDSVGLERWQDIWLNEGFATYSEALWTEHSQGASAFDDKIRSYYEDVATGNRFSGAYPPPGDPGPDELFSWSVYGRGALTLHVLRLKVGDEKFFEIMRTYYARYAGGNANTDDFIAVAEEVSGQQLDDLFQAWLYQENIPDIPEMGLHRSDFTP